MICNLCPRFCGIDREKGVGFCRVGAKSYVARTALHMWEEPVISGESGSGTIFFCGCNLRCLFCQNHEISVAAKPALATEVDANRLCDIMQSLQDMGANNINFVTPTPHIELIASAIKKARAQGLKIPYVYNTNSYVSVDALKKLDGLIDIYLPDLKYVTGKLAKIVSEAENYPEFAKAAIAQMYEQCGKLVLDERGMAKRGVLIRHLVLPGNIDETRRVLDYIAQTYPADMYISLMSQYFPTHKANELPPFDRKLLPKEYKRAVDYAFSLGLSNVFTQTLDAANAEFVPSWGEIF